MRNYLYFQTIISSVIFSKLFYYNYSFRSNKARIFSFDELSILLFILSLDVSRHCIFRHFCRRNASSAAFGIAVSWRDGAKGKRKNRRGSAVLFSRIAATRFPRDRSVIPRKHIPSLSSHNGDIGHGTAGINVVALRRSAMPLRHEKGRSVGAAMHSALRPRNGL